MIPPALMERCKKARAHYLSDIWLTIKNPDDFATDRMRLAALTAELGVLLAEAERDIAQVKKKRDELYLTLRKQDDVSAKDAEVQAKVDTYEELWKAEFERDELKGHYDGFKEILNALASKINTLTNEARNIS